MNNFLTKQNKNPDIKLILDVKEEYINQFINVTKDRFKEGYQSIYDNVKDNNKVSKLILKEFQDKLKLVPLWSEKMIEDEFNRIKIVSKCDYLGELIESLFLSYSQMFQIVNKKNFQSPIKIPSHHYVLHNCYIEIARELWKRPQLFYHKYDTKKIQEMNIELDNLIKESIIKSIKNLLPFKDLLDKIKNTDDKGKVDNHNDDDVQHDNEDDDNQDDDDEDDNNEDDDNEDEDDEDDDNEDDEEDDNEDDDNEDNDNEDDDNEKEQEEDDNDIEIQDDYEIVNVNENDEIVEEFELKDYTNQIINNQKIENIEEEVNETNVENIEEEEVNETNVKNIEDEVNDTNVENIEEEVNDTKVENIEDEVNNTKVENIEDEVNNTKVENIEEEVNDYYNNDTVLINNENHDIKEINISKKKKKRINEKKIERYLGINVDTKDFKKNKEDIKRMLLHKSIANIN